MGYRFSVAIMVAVAAVLVVLCAQGIAISGGAWLAVYADTICAIDDVPGCAPELIGTSQLIHAIQLGSIVVIALLGAVSRRRGVRASMHLVDLVVLAACLGGSVAFVRWAWAHLESIDGAIASGVATVVAGYVIQRRFRDSEAMRPVPIFTFFVIKGAAFAGAMTPAIVGLKLSIRDAFPSSLFAGPVFMVIGGFCLAIPVAFAMLAFHRD